MKLNKIFMALAAMAVVGCSSDDLSVSAPQQAAEDSQLVELNPNFVIAGVGVEDNSTRTHWESDGNGGLVNKFLPIYEVDASGLVLEDAADLTAQAVGLCWLGNGAVGTDVYTNYQFYHFGWLNKGATEADLDKCGTLFNGSLYSDIGNTSVDGVANKLKSGTADNEANPTADFDGAIPTKSQTAGGADNLNYNSGVYKTDNKSIFGGKYIVYYPFDETFENAGTIPATAPTVFGEPAPGKGVSQAYNTPELGKATFRYSAPVEIKGGDQAANFGLYNLSTLVQLRAATPQGDPFAATKKIDQIVLVSKSEKFLKQANLAADKIVAGQKGEALYADKEGTKTITANFENPVYLRYTTNTSGPKVPTSAYITVLPTTVPDLIALVHNATDGTWATVDMGNTVFEAGKAKRLDIIVGKDDFKSELFAVDQASLVVALNKARDIVNADGTAKPTIEVIGDITLTANLDINDAKDANITIKGDNIIVPEDVILTAKTNMESKVRVLGKYCCGNATLGGRFVVEGGTINDVTMEPTEARVGDATDYNNFNPEVTYDGAATVAAGKTFDVQAGNVVVNNAVAHKGNITIAKDAMLTVNGATGKLNFMGSTVVNDGTIEVMKDGKFDMTDAKGNATANDGKRMTNNGKFIHNVDAGVGTAVQSMKQNGEYRCKVDDQVKLDDAFLQWTACSVIEMVDAGADRNYDLGTASKIEEEAYKHNGEYIDIEVNVTDGYTTTFFNPTTVGNADNKEIQVGDLTVTSGELYVDYVKKAGSGANETTGRRTLTVNGNMTVKDDTEFTDSKKINIKKNLTVEGATLTYQGAKANVDGLAVTGDITVSDGGDFDAGAVNAIKITCENFYLKGNYSTAEFGNRTDGDTKNLLVRKEISNPATCTFDIIAAGQDGNGSVLAWVTCKTLTVGGTFTGSQPRVE